MGDRGQWLHGERLSGRAFQDSCWVLFSTTERMVASKWKEGGLRLVQGVPGRLLESEILTVATSVRRPDCIRQGNACGDHQELPQGCGSVTIQRPVTSRFTCQKCCPAPRWATRHIRR